MGTTSHWSEAVCGFSVSAVEPSTKSPLRLPAVNLLFVVLYVLESHNYPIMLNLKHVKLEKFCLVFVH